MASDGPRRYNCGALKIIKRDTILAIPTDGRTTIAIELLMFWDRMHAHATRAHTYRCWCSFEVARAINIGYAACHCDKQGP